MVFNHSQQSLSYISFKQFFNSFAHLLLVEMCRFAQIPAQQFVEGLPLYAYPFRSVLHMNDQYFSCQQNPISIRIGHVEKVIAVGRSHEQITKLKYGLSLVDMGHDLGLASES